MSLLDNNPAPRNSSALSVAITGRYSLEDGSKIRGTAMSRFADKIINYQGDKAGLEALQAEFMIRFGRRRVKASTPSEVKFTDWKKYKDDAHTIYTNIPKVVTSDKKIYAVFTNIMCGSTLKDACNACGVNAGTFRNRVKCSVRWAYTEAETGTKVTSDSTAGLAREIIKHKLDGPQNSSRINQIMYTNGGTYHRDVRGGRKGTKTGLIGMIDKKTYVQEVIYKGEDNGQGDQA